MVEEDGGVQRCKEDFASRDLTAAELAAKQAVCDMTCQEFANTYMCESSAMINQKKDTKDGRRNAIVWDSAPLIVQGPGESEAAAISDLANEKILADSSASLYCADKNTFPLDQTAIENFATTSPISLPLVKKCIPIAARFRRHTISVNHLRSKE